MENSDSKVVVAIINFLILFWVVFLLQRLVGIEVELKYNAGVALLISPILTYIIWRQQLNFNSILKYAGIFSGIGFILGIAIIFIISWIEGRGDGQAIFLILLTTPIGWLLGMTISVVKAKISLSRSNKNGP